MGGQNLDGATHGLPTDGKCARQFALAGKFIADTEQTRCDQCADFVCNDVAHGPTLQIACEPGFVVEEKIMRSVQTRPH